MSETKYSLKQLQKLTGLTRRNIRYYISRGLVDGAEGQGRGAYYTQRHLARLLQIKAFQEDGYSLEQIASGVVLTSTGAPPRLVDIQNPEVPVWVTLFFDGDVHLQVREGACEDKIAAAEEVAAKLRRR